MTKAAVFDLDGVLLDSMGIWNDLGARYLRSLGVTPEEGLNEILFSMSMEQGAEYLHTHYALPQSAAEVGAGIADMLRDFYFYEVPAKDGAAALLAALRNDCRLVLVGDPDQLPSVGPGNLFGDLIRSGTVPTVRLTQIFRQAAQSAIVRNAHLVNAGEMPDLRKNEDRSHRSCKSGRADGS